MAKLSMQTSATLGCAMVIVSAVIFAAFSRPVQAAPKAVVELFTSQGCSSCPPADRLMERLSKANDAVLPLVFPVDYWDYLGWKDTLAKPAFSARQRTYAARRGDRSVYTPQVIIDGGEHIVGSNQSALKAALKRAAPFTAGINLALNDMAIEATVEGSLPKGAHMATVFFVRIKGSETVAIGRGENSGRTVTYVNVVRNIQPIGMWSGGKEVFRMPKSELMNSNDDRCAVLIQLEDDEGPGPIIGAAIMDFPAH